MVNNEVEVHVPTYLKGHVVGAKFRNVTKNSNLACEHDVGM